MKMLCIGIFAPGRTDAAQSSFFVWNILEPSRLVPAAGGRPASAPSPDFPHRQQTFRVRLQLRGGHEVRAFRNSEVITRVLSRP